MNHSYTNIDQLTTCTTSVALGVFELLHDYSKKYSEILDNPASFFTPYTQASDNSRALVQKEVNLQSLRPRFPTLSTSLFEHVFSEVWDYLAEEGIGVETKALLWGNVLKQASGQQFWNRLSIVDQNGKTCSLEDFQRQMINLLITPSFRLKRKQSLECCKNFLLPSLKRFTLWKRPLSARSTTNFSKKSRWNPRRCLGNAKRHRETNPLLF